MAGVAAGIVTAGDVNSQPAQTGGLSLQSPAVWAHIWFGVSIIYLVGIYFGHIRIAKIA
jgi:hypothetical protein